MLSLEKVLADAERRGLADAAALAGTGFNPLTRLAQQLMRNNPRTPPPPSAEVTAPSAYTLSLRAIQEQLNSQCVALGRRQCGWC